MVWKVVHPEALFPRDRAIVFWMRSLHLLSGFYVLFNDPLQTSKHIFTTLSIMYHHIQSTQHSSIRTAPQYGAHCALCGALQMDASQQWQKQWVDTLYEGCTWPPNCDLKPVSAVFFCAESHLWWKPVNFLILQTLKQIGLKFQICQSFAAICKCEVFFRRVTRTKKIAWSDGHGSWRATSDDTCANYSQHVLGAWFFPAVFCLEPPTCLFHQQSWNISKGMNLIFTCKLMYSHHKYIYI